MGRHLTARRVHDRRFPLDLGLGYYPTTTANSTTAAPAFPTRPAAGAVAGLVAARDDQGQSKAGLSDPRNAEVRLRGSRW